MQRGQFQSPLRSWCGFVEGLSKRGSSCGVALRFDLAISGCRLLDMTHIGIFEGRKEAGKAGNSLAMSVWSVLRTSRKGGTKVAGAAPHLQFSQWTIPCGPRHPSFAARQIEVITNQKSRKRSFALTSLPCNTLYVFCFRPLVSHFQMSPQIKTRIVLRTY